MPWKDESDGYPVPGGTIQFYTSTASRTRAFLAVQRNFSGVVQTDGPRFAHMSTLQGNARLKFAPFQERTVREAQPLLCTQWASEGASSATRARRSTIVCASHMHCDFLGRGGSTNKNVVRLCHSTDLRHEHMRESWSLMERPGLQILKARYEGLDTLRRAQKPLSLRVHWLSARLFIWHHTPASSAMRRRTSGGANEKIIAEKQAFAMTRACAHGCRKVSAKIARRIRDYHVLDTARYVGYDSAALGGGGGGDPLPTTAF